MELMFAEWEDGERFSFEDSDRFEEDSLCSFISEAESLCQNWRGWRKQSAGPNSPTVKMKDYVYQEIQTFGPHCEVIPKESDGLVIPLVELSAKQVAFHIPFEVVEKVYPPVPEQLQLRIAFWSFPENEEDIRLYSCLANGSADEFQRGEQLFRMRAVKDPLQIGFHLSATVIPPQMVPPKGAYNVAVMFDRCRITSCSCTCGAGAKWCAHVVALCLFRIHNASAVCLRAPVSESLSRLQRDQLQKFAQYLISELPQQILPTAQRLLDELLSSQSTAINTVCGAPDPTAGPSASDQSTWYLDESTLSDNIKKTLHKFCGPSPVVFSDVNSMYLSSTEPPAAAEWACLLRPLRGREPEGIWNLLSIVREMFKRRDTNAAPLLEILTDQCLTYEQITGWWYSVRTSASHSSASGHTGRSNGQSEVAAHACASMCDEMVVLWRLAVLDPTISPHRRRDLCTQLKQWQLKVIDNVKRGQHKKSLEKLFQGFKPAVEACYFNWEEAYPIPGITYSSADKKNSFCWVKAIQQRNSRSQCGETISEAGRAHGLDISGTCLQLGDRSCPASQEPAVRPKELIGKRKVVSEGPQRVLRRLSAEGDKAVYKTAVNKGKLPVGKNLASKHSGKRRMSSEDSSLEPDMAESTLDDSSLALGAEASNTFSFTDSPSSRSYRDAFEDDGGVYFSETTEPTLRSSPSSKKNPKDPVGETGSGDDDIPCPDESTGGVILKPKEVGENGAAGGGGEEEEDDYQVYYLNPQEVAKEEDDKAEGGVEEDQDVFAGIQPLEQENRMEILFACAEALYAHGYSNEACHLTVELAKDLLANPPDLKVEQPPTKGKKNKVSTSKQTWMATNTLSKAAFLLTVLSERQEYHNLAFQIGMFALELQRPPASTKALEVKLAYQESEIVALLKKIPLGSNEMNTIRGRAEELREGTLCDYRPVLPLMLASFIFDVLCTPVVSPTGSRPPSRNWNNEMPGDEELGFEAAVAALGMKTTVSEAEHPLLCEGTRREKGDLALALMITYKDDQSKLKKILDKLLDRESQTHKPQTLSSFYSSSKPTVANQKSPSKHASQSAAPIQHLPGTSVTQQAGVTTAVQSNTSEPFLEKSTQENPQRSACDPPAEPSVLKHEGKVPSRLALGNRGGYNGRCWGSPVRQKKKHTGMASIDSSAPETTSDSSPTLSRRPLRGGWAATSWGRGQDSDSISSSSSDSLGSSSSSGSRRASGGARAKTVEVGRYKGRRPESHAPHVPNQPSEAAAHFYFELAKTVLIKAGGNSSTSIFTHPSSSGGHQGPHRNLHLCAFEIGLYALGLHNFVSPNWLSRTYSSHVSWITGQAMEIGSAALNILVECWDGHLTPPEVASLADRASRARDSNMVRAAAELALSCLPHAHALNPNEIQRALVQCKEQDNLMLEKACLAVEEAAKGGGVYPEVLFEVAHQWYWLYEQTVGGTLAQREGATGCSASGARASCEAVRGLADARVTSEPTTVTVAAAVTAAATVVPVISVGSTIYQQHTMAGPAMAHAHTQGLHPYTTLQTHIPCNPQYIGHPIQHMPRPAVFPVPGSAYPQAGLPCPLPLQGVHPAFIGAQYPYSVTTPSLAATAVSFPGVPVPSMTQIAVHPYHAETGLSLSSNVARSVHAGSTFPAIQGTSLTSLSSQPNSLVTGGFPSEDEQHSQPAGNQGVHHLHSAYRVGMLALEMLGRRAHNDHPNNFSRSPPYTEDVKWLLGLAAKLGVNYVHQFCLGAAKGVLSPFVLQEIIMESLQRLNPAHVHNHLRTPAFHQLVQRCQQAYIQYIHHRLIHLTPADYDDFVNAIRSARSAFCLTPMGMMQFNDILQNLKRSKQTKDLWQRVSLEMTTFSP
ncbi:zinc finger SWIM domain-containing protein 8 isoform X2 [Rhineura floridana]|uniref:zinc finger SWIM domain-containing protein 8 isoform X2 n=1 Tax=Rhineura floridana TaxID=261503 RepID=UPI002AC7EF74|nr:zinc finger SWIM domain-containing protein 8 isoform X2 [Rhineura floridana]